MKLVIGNKNYSSWSMRPWILLTQLGIPFEEERVSLAGPALKARLLRISPAGRVPVLIDGDLLIWDSLAIIEYLAERFPEASVWPKAREARARARSIVAEMHAGFSDLRNALPMNCELHLPSFPLTGAVRNDIARVVEIWTECRTRFGSAGPFLFGAFSAADAFYAPVVRRFFTYDVALPGLARRYADTIDALPAMRTWMDAALAEHDFVDWDEPYRDPPA
jgi:glutathione S-transferase